VIGDPWLKPWNARRLAVDSIPPSIDPGDDPAPEADPVPNYGFVRCREPLLIGAPTVRRANGVLFAGDGGLNRIHPRH
jgi:hypothetical protein